MDPNEQLLRRFYEALGRRDAETVCQCYDDDAEFSDPVFRNLKGEEIRNMWRMLCARAEDLEVTVSRINISSARSGRAGWTATYTFSGTGNKVVNDIHSGFVFRDGKIVSQSDQFDLYKWMRQAMGMKGLLLGWLPPVQSALRAQARKNLENWRPKEQ